MKVLFSLPQRYDATPDGAVWVKTGFAYEYWARLLEVFDGVKVLARVRKVESVSPDMLRVDGESVTVCTIPYYVGPWEYLSRALQVKQAAKNSFRIGDAVIFYGGGPQVDALERVLRKTGYPYAVHVGADPYDVYAPGSVKNILRPYFRWSSPRRLRKICCGASVAAYVTEQALQKRYPCPGFTVNGLSNVILPDDSIAAEPRPGYDGSRPFTLLFVGTLAQLYKAPDVLIKATAQCIKSGLDLNLVIVGDGKHRTGLKEDSARLGINDRVYFRGQLPAGNAIRNEMDNADLFVLPSYQEGLPRAMIEAMARGMPCIGSTVGGIPELLPDEDLVPPGDVQALAMKIIEIAQNRERQSQMSARNLIKAANYCESVLYDKRTTFYRKIRQATENWLLNRCNLAVEV